MSEGEGAVRPDQERRARAAGSRLYVALGVVVAILLVAGVITLLQRRAQYQALAEETESNAIPTVAVIHPTAEPPQEDLVLPGTLQAYVESPIYARTNGYLKKWYHDIGTRVRQGEVLADIDTPEVDQELSQAKATRQQIAANLELAKTSAERWESLRKSDSVSQQEVDERTSAYTQMQANLAAADANFKRLEELESFKHIYAPFSGVITKRSVDIGTLITAGSGSNSQLLFHLAQTDPIRVYVSVPETYASEVRVGLAAYLELTQYSGQKFQGKVSRTAEAIDPGTRTLLTEVDVPNHQGQLLPGGYAQVHLALHVTLDRLQVPVNALLFRSEGLRAVTVDAKNRVHLQTLTIGRDYGTSLEVLQGLTKGDWIVINPADSLEDGQEVRVKQPQPAQKPGAAPVGNTATGGVPKE